jgi:hypothetical protein
MRVELRSKMKGKGVMSHGPLPFMDNYFLFKVQYESKLICLRNVSRDYTSNVRVVVQ